MNNILTPVSTHRREHGAVRVLAALFSYAAALAFILWLCGFLSGCSEHKTRVPGTVSLSDTGAAIGEARAVIREIEKNKSCDATTILKLNALEGKLAIQEKVIYDQQKQLDNAAQTCAKIGNERDYWKSKHDQAAGLLWKWRCFAIGGTIGGLILGGIGGFLSRFLGFL